MPEPSDDEPNGTGASQACTVRADFCEPGRLSAEVSRQLSDKHSLLILKMR
jgi:hypothetical protein